MTSAEKYNMLTAYIEGTLSGYTKGFKNATTPEACSDFASRIGMLRDIEEVIDGLEAEKPLSEILRSRREEREKQEDCA